MKLRLIKNQHSDTPTPAPSKHSEEMNHLYERLATNPYGDSESVRQLILARMIHLTFQHLPK